MGFKYLQDTFSTNSILIWIYSYLNYFLTLGLDVVLKFQPTSVLPLYPRISCFYTFHSNYRREFAEEIAVIAAPIGSVDSTLLDSPPIFHKITPFLSLLFSKWRCSLMTKCYIINISIFKGYMTLMSLYNITYKLWKYGLSCWCTYVSLGLDD